jgi:hypothetical protein
MSGWSSGRESIPAPSATERRRLQQHLTHLGGDIGTSYAWQAGLLPEHLAAGPGLDDVDSLGTGVTSNLPGNSALDGV